MELDVEVAKLKIAKSNHQSEIYRLKDKLRDTFPQAIKRTEAALTALEKDIQQYAQNSSKVTHFDILIGGGRYDKPEEAGKAILAACHASTSATPSEIGQYLGFKLAVSFQPFTKEFLLYIKGAGQYHVSLSDKPLGNIARLRNALEKLPEQLHERQQALGDLNKQTKIAQAEVAKPFPSDQLLNEKIKRLQEIDIALNLETSPPAQIEQSEEITKGQGESLNIKAAAPQTQELKSPINAEAEKHALLERARQTLGQDWQLAPTEPGRSYSGDIIETDENYAIQQTGPAQGIIHDLSQAPNLKTRLFFGSRENLEITYDEQGQCQIQSEHEHEHNLERGR
jgi:hypothetical protein